MAGVMSALGDEEKQDLMETTLQKKVDRLEKNHEEQEKKIKDQEKKLSRLYRNMMSLKGRGAKTEMTSLNLDADDADDLDLSNGPEDDEEEANETIVRLCKEQKKSFALLKNEVQTLCARVEEVVPNQNDASTDNDLLFTLPSDTFTLMMVYEPLTPAWNIGIFSFTFQMLLLILIWISQISEGDGSTPFNVPFKVDIAVRIGQFAVIFLCLFSQDDVLLSLQSTCALWKCDLTAFQASGRKDPDVPFHAAVEARSSREEIKYFALQIFLPNLLKFAQGVFVLVVSWVIVAQGQNLIDLLKDSTALFFVSTIDNAIFVCAHAGYFGQEVGRLAQAPTEKPIVDGQKWSFKARSIVVIIIGSLMVASLSYLSYGQLSGNFFEQKYPDCVVTDVVAAISKITNGKCDGGELNTLECAFDGGDCINHNLAFPGCNVKDPEVQLGNGECDGDLYNTPECKYDNGDCIIANYTDCHTDNIELVGDGVCHLELNTVPCGNDSGDCDVFNKYPNCDIPDPDQLGDGTCDSSPYDSILCGFDSGDCVVDLVDMDEYGCKTHHFNPTFNITELGDGKCNAPYNNLDCSWDGKDCLEFNAKYPVILNSTQYLAEMTQATVTSLTSIPTATSPTRTNLVMELVILAHMTQFYAALILEIVWLIWLIWMSTVAKLIISTQLSILQSLEMESAMPPTTT